ncbi:hypothetical protein BJV78DRAFT_1174262 [Lactifluus subvellereus]|nr:hypothetical protein BJV78DRAFT_1174262 [Lactifluus subvellereus]
MLIGRASSPTFALTASSSPSKMQIAQRATSNLEANVSACSRRCRYQWICGVVFFPSPTPSHAASVSPSHTPYAIASSVS